MLNWKKTVKYGVSKNNKEKGKSTKMVACVV